MKRALFIALWVLAAIFSGPLWRNVTLGLSSVILRRVSADVATVRLVEAACNATPYIVTVIMLILAVRGRLPGTQQD